MGRRPGRRRRWRSRGRDRAGRSRPGRRWRRSGSWPPRAGKERARSASSPTSNLLLGADWWLAVVDGVGLVEVGGNPLGIAQARPGCALLRDRLGDLGPTKGVERLID